MPRPSVTRRTAIASAVAATLAAGAVPLTTADAAVPAGPKGWVQSTLARMTLEEKVGQLFVQQVYGQDANTTATTHTRRRKATNGQRRRPSASEPCHGRR